MNCLTLLVYGILVFGLTANILFLLISRKKNGKSALDFVIASLAISDVIHASDLVYSQLGFFGNLSCKIFLGVLMAAWFAVISAMTLSYIIFALNPRVSVTKIKMLLLVIWIAAAMRAFPFGYFAYTTEGFAWFDQEAKKVVCISDYKEHYLVGIVGQILSPLAALILIEVPRISGCKLASIEIHSTPVLRVLLIVYIVLVTPQKFVYAGIKLGFLEFSFMLVSTTFCIQCFAFCYKPFVFHYFMPQRLPMEATAPQAEELESLRVKT